MFDDWLRFAEAHDEVECGKKKKKNHLETLLLLSFEERFQCEEEEEESHGTRAEGEVRKHGGSIYRAGVLLGQLKRRGGEKKKSLHL